MASKVKQSLTSKNIALSVFFSSLYAFSCLFPVFQIIGLQNKSITMAAILAPVIGILFGPYVGALSTLIGGYIGFFVGNLSLPSLISGAVAAFFAGSTRQKRKGGLSIFLYFSLLFTFGFYPFVGPVWLFPPVMWFQMVGFFILIWLARHKGNLDSTINFFKISLTSTLAGQIAGSLTFEIISWPIFLADLNAWKMNWQVITFLYPIERITIASGSTCIGVAVYRALKTAGLVQTVNCHPKGRS